MSGQIQRYLSAVESGRAEGWHTLVYGLTLAVYSFPLRQGLLHYARETISGLALAATEPGTFIDPACQEMLETILARLPEAVERLHPALPRRSSHVPSVPLVSIFLKVTI